MIDISTTPPPPLAVTSRTVRLDDDLMLGDLCVVSAIGSERASVVFMAQHASTHQNLSRAKLAELGAAIDAVLAETATERAA